MDPGPTPARPVRRSSPLVSPPLSNEAVTGLAFVVYGKPATKGSMRPVRNQHTNRIRLVEEVARSKPFREAVKFAALDARNEVRRRGLSFQTLFCPVEVDVTFYFPKPKNAPKKRRSWPISRRSGDVDKLQRNLFDALVDAGVVGDDAQIVKVTAEKAYVGEPHSELAVPGAHIMVRPLAAWRAEQP